MVYQSNLNRRSEITKLRRDRIVNITGSNTTVVNHILVKGAISDQVYKKVSKKEDFNNSTYISQNI